MIGETISHYKILEELGRGGMGVVYKAEDTKLKRTVALKFLPPGLTSDPEAKERFVHEAQAASALEHPNICNIHEIDETADGQIFICMAHYEGEPLKNMIERGPLKLDKAIETAIRIGEGLARAHESDITHRDIKPANIMITSRGEVKIVDFGLAKLAGKTKLTKEGSTLGTVEYMSPEQARGEDVNHRTDIWSLGVVFYELLTGRPPFGGDYDQAVIYSILNEEPAPVTSLRAGLPLEVDRVLAKALAKNPGERYQHACDLLVDLRSLLKQIMPGATPQRIVSKKSKKNLTLLLGGVLIIIIVFFLLRNIIFPEKAEVIDSIAVLPLENLSRDPEQEYFTDGMTENLIANLARISALKVISRTSVMRYKDTDKSLPEIARELNVDAVIEGSVLRAGDRVRITAQLVEAKEDRHIWANTYDRDLNDILDLQSEVARAIAHEIKIELTPGENARLTEERKVNPEAHEAYLKGRYHWNKRTKTDLEKSVVHFEDAIRIDPDYATAYAGLADAYIVLADWGHILPKDGYAKAKEIALRALELDENNAEAHTAYAAALKLHEYKWKEAEEEYKLAIELNPSYATARQWHAEQLWSQGRFDEAFQQIERAQELDPLSLIISTVRGSIYLYARRYDDAIDQCKKALELDSGFWLAHQILGIAYTEKGMYEAALEEKKVTMMLVGAESDKIAALEQAFRRDGIKGIDMWLIEEGIELYDEKYNKPYYYAAAYARVGEIDKAFECLEKTYEVGSMYILYIASEPALDTLRSDARFDDLLRRVGLAKKKRD